MKLPVVERFALGLRRAGHSILNDVVLIHKEGLKGMKIEVSKTPKKSVSGQGASAAPRALSGNL